jgi:serine/threonine-protein kinase
VLPPGTRVGDYEIEAELGAGGMATVYRVRHALLDSRYALKVLDPRYRASAAARARFLDEARIQHRHLDHPNIVKVVNVVATADHAALVMELVEGPSLDDAQAELRGRPDEVKRIMIAVLDAVGHAHAAGIVHRDLKPANVLLHRKGERLYPKVTDFGIAKLSSALAAPGKQSTQGDHRMGTLGYMSPEQIVRARDVTAQSDIFSLGVMLYELATGALPFAGDNEYEVMDRVIHGRYPPPEEQWPAIDAVIARVVRRALAVAPGERFASCDEMAAALQGEAAQVEARAADEDSEWDVHEPTPLPPVQAIAVAPAASLAPPAARGASAFRAFDVRSAGLRSVERALVPAASGLAAGLAVGLPALALFGALPAAFLAVIAGAIVGVKVDAHRERRGFRAAATLMVRIDARAAHRAKLAMRMHELGFEPSDETEHASLHPIEALAAGVEARTFQVATSNLAAIDAVFVAGSPDGGDDAATTSRELAESPEGFAELLAQVLWQYGVDGAGAHCLVRVLQWQRPR